MTYLTYIGTSRENTGNGPAKKVSKSLLELKSLLNLVASDESHFFLYGFIPNKHIIFTAQAGVHPYRMEVRRCSFTPRPSFFLPGQSAHNSLTYKSATS